MDEFDYQFSLGGEISIHPSSFFRTTLQAEDLPLDATSSSQLPTPPSTPSFHLDDDNHRNNNETEPNGWNCNSYSYSNSNCSESSNSIPTPSESISTPNPNYSSPSQSQSQFAQNPSNHVVQTTTTPTATSNSAQLSQVMEDDNYRVQLTVETAVGARNRTTFTLGICNPHPNDSSTTTTPLLDQEGMRAYPSSSSLDYNRPHQILYAKRNVSSK